MISADNTSICMNGSRKFFRRGSSLATFFLADKGLQIPLKAGHHRLGAKDGPTLNAGLVVL